MFTWWAKDEEGGEDQGHQWRHDLCLQSMVLPRATSIAPSVSIRWVTGALYRAYNLGAMACVTV